MMIRHFILTLTVTVVVFGLTTEIQAVQITTAGQPAQLGIRAAGEHSIRITLKPVTYEGEFLYTPALAEREYANPVISRETIWPDLFRVKNDVDIRSIR